VSFNPEPKASPRVKKNLSMNREAAELLAKLAYEYDSTEGKVLEALLKTYGPVLLRDAQRASG
jgi:hypothetical protein